ncbi:MAG: DPP IV N-terminal domain-containing protein [Bacteroidota bacterium]
MKTKKTGWILLIAVASLLLLNSNLFSQQPASQLFEKAVYLEEGKGELQGAINLYQQILENHSTNREVAAKSMLHLGFCYEKLGLEQAREMYTALIDKYPDQKEEVTLAKKRVNSLEAYADNLAKKAKEHLKNGNDLFSRWEYESAIEQYRKAMEFNPNSLLALNAQYCIGQSWFRAGKHDLALEIFQKLMEENPESNIAPVTELMIAQVEHAMKADDNSSNVSYYTDANTIVSEQGITFRKYKTFVGKNDRITYANGDMSPDCRFLVGENTVVPVDGSDAFQLVVMDDAYRTVYSPNIKKAAFYADSAIWMVPVSPETGRATGKPKKLIEGGYKYQASPSWSPDGNQLVFERIDDEVYSDIYTISVDNGNLNPLVVSPKEEVKPVWSPDGKSIVFLKDRNKNNLWDLWLTSINGEESKMIIENAGYNIVFSSDSKWLFHYGWGNSHLYSFEKKKNYKLEIPKHIGSFASFSPDDEKMYFYKPSYDDKWGMKIVSASGGPSFAPSAASIGYGSDWVPNGQKILALSEDENENPQYKIISLTGEKPRPIEINEEFNGTPFPFAISPDMTQMIFHVEHEENRKDLYIIPFSMEEAKTTGPAKLIFNDWTGGAHNVTFSWSPDGNKIAVAHKGDIWKVNLKNGEKKQLTQTDENEHWISWSPDGEMIKYCITNEGNRNLYTIPEYGGNPKLIFKNVNTCNWSPDEKKAVIDSENEIKIISMETGEVLENIVSTEELGVERFYSSIVYSPDGKHLAFICDYHEDGYSKTVLYKYSFETKEITRLTDGTNNGFQYALYWSPDSKWISYLISENVKVRPEGVLWEAGFEEVKEKITGLD